ncbi:CRTAC1 family protein [Spongiivirga citrea]|uniref:ASPIC/UnbV domain-containing protein n=1 Tax=Spongiivirga citrea TaxID=1481457 RepID=A0A6M0CG93_9FLAO|nr:CRTAC1 family protein [Spongiivirga citrea]NER16926.1 hypothetical protein [Spongiivirga citrea]
MNKLVLIIVLSIILVGCDSSSNRLFSNPSAKETGIQFVNTLTDTDEMNILDYLYYYNGGGVAIGDINNDSLPDIFFSGNQVKNQLYLNKGNLSFENISEKAGIEGNSTWNTGAIMGDVNGDGLLDIYVCAVVGVNGFDGYNELYINNGDATFTESAAKYGLDFDSYSSSAAFLDYDLDGDLDIYLLNHAIHTQESYGKANLRFKRSYETGDKLLQNDNGKFIDVSEKAGIYGGINGYGLGVAISDFNDDGFPDIYVGNDFHEDDYYYLNNGDGTFKESVKDHFGHITRFSMGSDVADINHDGLPDIISLDMLPEDEKALKSTEGDDNIQTQKLRIERYGYHYQFTRNMLQINQPDGNFIETALLSGIAATDWSWSALFGDYNQDGEQDLFISNGIPKRPNDLDFINFVSNDQIQQKINNTKLVDDQAINMIPSGAVSNYVFSGTPDLRFKDESQKWITNDTLVSGATAYGDLDNDGDLDIITNNIDAAPTIYINNTNEKANYLKLSFNYKSENWFGIGTKIYSYHKGVLQYKELYPVRGFQASSEPIIHFGYGNTTIVDSIKVVWPDRTFQLMHNVETNQSLKIELANTQPVSPKNINKTIFNKVTGNLGINFKHKEDNYTDFNRQKLIPFQFSDRGPALAIGDINDDGKDDIFFGGSKFNSATVFAERDSVYTKTKIPQILKDSINEEVAAIIKDFDGDGKNDLVIGTGGGDFFGEAKPLLDSYFRKNSGSFKRSDLPEMFENASVISAADFDNDGDDDLFIGNQMVTTDYGKIPNSYLLKNNNGNFEIIENTELQNAGMITDAIWDDFNNDGSKDLILVGEWMQPKFFANINGELAEVKMLDELIGLWQCISPFDIDEDGDTDYVLGNFGLNTKFKASEKHPLKMYYGDFDANGSTETIVAVEKDGSYYTLATLDDLASQMVSLKKKFTSYQKFAGSTVEEIIDSKQLKNAKTFKVTELKSGYLKNEKGSFVFVPFEQELQLAPITSFVKYDFDNDQKEELLIAGNYFGVKPYHGRFNAFPGALINNENDIILGNRIGLDFLNKSARHLNILHLNKKPYLMATFNNDSVQVYSFKTKIK